MSIADPRWEPSDHEAVDAQRLDEHLIHDHGRSPHEITGLPLHAVHDLEHFDDAMGLLDLHHRHDGRYGAGR